NEHRFCKRVLRKTFSDERNKSIRTLTKIDRLGGHEHPHPGRNGDHAVVLSRRSTSLSHARSTFCSATTTAPPISIRIDPVSLVFPPPSAMQVELTIGTNVGALSSGIASKPFLAFCRHVNRCCGLISCRRATSDTTAPAANDSATILPFSSSDHLRRRPTPVRISILPRSSLPARTLSTIGRQPIIKAG